MSLAYRIALLFVGALIPKGEFFRRATMLPVIGLAIGYGKWKEVQSSIRKAYCEPSRSASSKKYLLISFYTTSALYVINRIVLIAGMPIRLSLRSLLLLLCVLQAWALLSVRDFGNLIFYIKNLYRVELLEFLKN